ncbi:MAG: FAD-dependent oxidoreductase [Roseovarius sp.]
MTPSQRTAVIGAGIQGSLAALALAERGASVTLFDKAAEAVGAASLANEGKIHLGYIFANDPGGRSARLMLQGARAFADILGRYVDLSQLSRNLSTPFVYAVMPDSLLTPDELAAHYARVDALIREQVSDYLGCGRPAPVRRIPRLTEASIACFETEERSIDPRFVARQVRAALAAHPRIDLRLQTEVATLTPDPDGGAPALTLADGQMETGFDHVINASWADRLRLDAMMAPPPDRPWLFRRKIGFYLEPQSPAPRLASSTLVLGPYGDVVNFDAGRHFYVSWYPTGCIGYSSALAPPGDWALPLAHEDSECLLSKALHRLEPVVPGVSALGTGDMRFTSRAEAIFSWGRDDIDHRMSELHQRHDVGPVSLTPHYHTIDTGKYTLAPLFAETLATRLMPR